MRPVLPLVLLLACGCTREKWDDCVTSTGPMRTEERAVGAFTAIDLRGRVDLVLEARPAGTVAVEGGANLLGQVETYVEEGVLRIRNANRCNWVRSFKPRITVHAPADGLCRITLRGVGNARCADTLRCTDLLVEQWGGEGSAELLVSAHRIDAALHTGAGDARITGRCTEASLYSGFMGAIDASALQAEAVRVNNSGVADIRCWALHELDAAVRSAGDVYYRGSPAAIRATITGSGRLIQAD